MPDHHVEQQVLHLQHGAIARRAVGVDAFREEVGGPHPVPPCPLVGILGLEGRAQPLLRELGIACLPGRIALQLIDEILAEIHEVQAEIGRHAVLLAVELHCRQDLVAEDAGQFGREGDGVHERGVTADGVGGEQVDVELLGAGGQISLQLVEEAVSVEEDQADLVIVRGGAVVELGHGAERHLLRPAGPAEDRHLGPCRCRRGAQRQGPGQCEKNLSHTSSPPWIRPPPAARSATPAIPARAPSMAGRISGRNR